jgi:hypothetical protein
MVNIKSQHLVELFRILRNKWRFNYEKVIKGVCLLNNERTENSLH